MAVWEPKVTLIKKEIGHNDYQLLLESLAKIIYDHFCQAQLNLKLVNSIEPTRSPKGFKKVGSI